MTEELIEIEGTWEEILAHADLLAGRRLHVTAYPRVEGANAEGDPTPGIEERILATFADVPDSEWERLPADLSDNLDHYIYGTPRRPEP